jgi:uncharacterized protein YjbJ (UPF0337 family)
MLLLTLIGITRYVNGGLHSLASPHGIPNVPAAIGPFLVLHAYASGTTALTGVEAISNGVPIFRPVEWRVQRPTGWVPHGRSPNGERRSAMAKGTGDKIEGKVDKAKGQVKEAAGKATNDRSTEIEGKKDQVKGEGKQAWGDVKNAGQRVKEAVKDARTD